jgi:hypothetical protein
MEESYPSPFSNDVQNRTPVGSREQARARELGVERFITKPLDLEDFLQIGHVVKEALLKSASGHDGGIVVKEN